MSTTILALDTSTEACSVALLYQEKITQKFILGKHRHTELILPMLDELLAEQSLHLNQIDGIAFGRGPGSFTGLRIAASVTQAIAYAHDIPVIPISTLAAIAQQTYNDTAATHVVAAIDARIQEVYWGQYQLAENGLMQLIGEEHVSKPEAAHFSIDKTLIGAGSGWDTYHEIFLSRAAQQIQQWIPNYFPRAEFIAKLALKDWQAKNVISAQEVVPVYLRDNVVREIGKA